MILVEDLPSAVCYVEALLGSVRLGPRPRAGEACHGCWEGSPLPGMRPTRRWDGSRLMWEIGPLSAVPRTGALPVRGLPWCEVSACAACDCDVAPCVLSLWYGAQWTESPWEGARWERAQF